MDPDVAQIRREALEEKRKKLEKLRADKAAKEVEVAAKRDGKELSGTVSAPPTHKGDEPSLDDLVKSLLVNGDNNAQHDMVSAEELADRERRQRAAKMAALASQHNVVNINIPSKDVPVYDKGVQTADMPPPAAPNAAASSSRPKTPRGVGLTVTDADSNDKGTDSSANNTANSAPANLQPARFEIAPLSEQQRQEIIGSAGFLDFVAHATHLASKALEMAERAQNLRKNYADDESKDVSAGKVLDERCVFYDETLCKNRAVMDISFSQRHPELVVVAYSDRLHGAMDEGGGGMVIVWNTLAPSTPEMVLHCPSSVLRAFVSQFNPNLIVGSTYSGQVVVWDKTQLPRDRVLPLPTHRTPLSPLGHTFPVYSLDLIGSDNAHSLITVSTDGKLRTWSVSQLSEPQGTGLDLRFPANGGGAAPAPTATGAAAAAAAKAKEEPLAVTCTAFVDGDSNTCVMGTESGELFTVARITNGEPIVGTNAGHEGPITSVSCHPVTGKVDFSGLMLSSSMDWTIRLWDRRQNVLLHTMEDSSDYVYDVKWSPTHPAVFGSVDGSGTLSIWNLNQETDLPITKISVGDHALNRVNWSKDGKLVAVGSSHGYCHVYEAMREVMSPDAGAWRQLSTVVLELQYKTDDAAARPAQPAQ